MARNNRRATARNNMDRRAAVRVSASFSPDCAERLGPELIRPTLGQLAKRPGSGNAELLADCPNRRRPKFAMARNGRRQAGWPPPLSVAATIADQSTAVIAKVSLEIASLHEATVNVSDSLSSGEEAPWSFSSGVS